MGNSSQDCCFIVWCANSGHPVLADWMNGFINQGFSTWCAGNTGKEYWILVPMRQAMLFLKKLFILSIFLWFQAHANGVGSELHLVGSVGWRPPFRCIRDLFKLELKALLIKVFPQSDTRSEEPP